MCTKDRVSNEWANQFSCTCRNPENKSGREVQHMNKDLDKRNEMNKRKTCIARLQ